MKNAEKFSFGIIGLGATIGKIALACKGARESKGMAHAGWCRVISGLLRRAADAWIMQRTSRRRT